MISTKLCTQHLWQTTSCLCTNVFFVMGLLFANTTYGQFVQGVSVDSFSSELGGGFSRLAVESIDGSGFDAINLTHTNDPALMWLSNGTFGGGNDPLPLLPGFDPNPFIMYDLGAVYDLSSINVWNYNEVSLTSRGSNNVFISAGPTSGSLTPLNNGNGGFFTFAEADGTNTYSGESFDVSGIAEAQQVQFVKIDILTNHGGDFNFVGLSEIRFAPVIVPDNLNWDGNVSNAWDQSTANWTGDDTVFSSGDNVTFGDIVTVSSPTVEIAENVSPSSVVFNGGAGSLYEVSGASGIVGTASVDVNSGSVQLQNTGNNYSGTTTVAAGARLEINTADVGQIALSGALSIGGTGTVTPGSGQQTLYFDDFSGDGTFPLNGTTPDTSHDNATWIAGQIWSDDGSNSSGTGESSGSSATLGFTPVDGAVYVMDISLVGTTSPDGTEEWFAFGFADGQSDQEGGSSQFTGGNVGGVAWGLHRGNDMASDNQTFIGSGAAPIQNVQSWTTPTNTAGGDVDIRITLDTSQGPGSWTVLFEADAFDGNGYQVIRAEESLVSEIISSVGFGIDSTAVTGSVGSFSLTGKVFDFLDRDVLTVNGDFTMGANSMLELDVAQTGFDAVDVTGIATLNGTIDITYLGSAEPIPGAEYTLLSATQGIVDSGVVYNLPAEATISIVNSTDLVLSFAAASGLTGDYNDDGVVDLADYTIWRNNLGEAETVLPDGTYTPGDGTIGEEEYTAWRANFGATSILSSGTNTSVPEPGTWLLALLGCTIAYTRLRMTGSH